MKKMASGGAEGPSRKLVPRYGLAGRIGLGRSRMFGVALSEGYSYSRSESRPEEVANLFRGVGWEEITEERERLFRQSLEDCDVGMLEVGVRDAHGTLVGIGRLLCRDQAGELGDLAVNPDHRRRGIGRAIIDVRLRAARNAGIESLQIAGIAGTNRLASYYQERHGFRVTEFGLIVRGPIMESIARIPYESETPQHSINR